MKKFVRTIALALAAVMVFGMTVFAAPSPGAGDGVSDLQLKLIEDYQGFNVKGDFTIGPVNPDWLARAKEYVANHPNVITGEVLTCIDIRHDGAATVTFNCKYFTGEGPFYVLHYYAKDWESDHYDKEAWEVIPVTKNDDGTYSFTSKSFSPFAFVKGTATAVVAPKTGEVIAISAILALIMMAGAVVCAKKARLQK